MAIRLRTCVFLLGCWIGLWGVSCLNHQRAKSGKSDASSSTLESSSVKTKEVFVDQKQTILASLPEHFRNKVVFLSHSPGIISLHKGQSITITDIRGIPLDRNPPLFKGESSEPWGKGPFVAPGITPFRFKYFNNEFNWGGWPQFVKKLSDYASTRGFNIVIHPDPQGPDGTQQIRWGHIIDWEHYFQKYGLEWQRWDQLVSRDVVSEILDQVWEATPNAIVMADLEHPWPLSLENLRRQPWYPAHRSEEERQAFERDYYQGFIKTHTAVMEALRKKGWKTVGIYPQPFTITWFPLLTWWNQDPATNGIPQPDSVESWKLYGKTIVLSQDILYPDHYLFYWDPANVAYQIAQNDYDMTFVKSLASHERKPMRPYYWPLLHGGDAHHEWWRFQPIPTEDMRASFFFVFTSGCDGVVLWNFSDRDETEPLPLKDYNYWENPDFWPGRSLELMVANPFTIQPISPHNELPPTSFKRYDVLAITKIDLSTNTIEFQKIDTSQKESKKFKRNPNLPTYRMSIPELIPFLRSPTDTVAGAVEGLALAKCFEEILAKGERPIDIPAIRQFAQSEPVIRRVVKDGLHLIATYDPQAVYYRQEGRSILLENFAGCPGRTLSLPADDQLRIFLLFESPYP